MFRKVLLTIGLLLAANVALFAQGTLKGTITDKKTGEPLFGVNVIAKDGDQMLGGAQTDFDGIYTIKGLPVGKCDIYVSFVGYATQAQAVTVKASGFTVTDFQLESTTEVLQTVQVKAERNPVIQIGEAAQGQRLSSEDIEKMPGNSVESIVAAVGGVGYSDGGTGTARGEEGMVTQVGGVRKRTGVNVPKEAIAEIQVILGGTPASIGEAIGGAQIITLKPPSSQFKGIVKYETYLDYRLLNNLMVYLTGPVYIQKKTMEDGSRMERTLIGFRFTGQGSYSKFGYYRAKDGRYQVVNDEKVMEIENSPILYDPISGSVDYAAEHLRASDFVTIKRPNARNYYANNERNADFSSYSINMEGALDFRFTENATLTLTGEYDYSFGPNTSLSYFPLNLTRAANGVQKVQNAVITLDFTHRIPNQKKESDDPNAETKTGITDVMYNINAFYNRYWVNSFNSNFGDNVFKYGHVGVFDRTRNTPTFEIQSNYEWHGTTQLAHVQNSWQERVNSFTPSEYNPILANYTSQLYTMEDISPFLTSFDNILMFKGLINGESPSSVYSIFSNVGIQNTDYAKQVNNYYYGQAKASANIGKHEIEIGLQYDQYTSAYYGLGASSLWSIMRQSANAHITQLDLDNPIQDDSYGSDLYIRYNRLVGDGQTLFDASLRQALINEGFDIKDYDWLNIDGYTPDFYMQHGGMEMFSANELFNSGNSIVSYYGYDHTGKIWHANSTYSLDDFFDPKAKGHENYQYLKAFSPIYAAGYIQDKFFFQDLIFNVGVRVDYFDGNQDVLKDPYLLYESYTVGDLRGNTDRDISVLGDYSGQIYSGAGDDWVVYVNDARADNPQIVGYRNGSVWYNADGVEISSPSAIAGESGKPTPFRTKDAPNYVGGQTIFSTGNASGNKVSSSAFKDYDPQIVVMPRIAFSFPVGEKSQFKASYDIIARRPSSGWQASYTDYLYMTQISTTNNPNLKPERVTNYEVGFQQALNDNSAFGISAYYKETRDLIQLVQYAGADPNPNYYSYDNLDFKTTKGFTFSYDLRQTNNIRVNANYTLQYAEGTGLSTTTMSELIKEGYTTLKMLNPISDDRRHEFKANIDFRYGRGKEYNGWEKKVARKDKKTGEMTQKVIRPFEGFGVNIMAVAQSGRPYTRAFSNTQSTIVGSYRGARLPWAFYFHVVADKTWQIDIKPEGKKVRHTFLNVALNVNNLFDTRNVLGVFSVTGNPTDNGYLTDPETQSVINAYLDPQSFRDMYQISLSNNYWNYCTPRLIKLALTYSF